MKDVKVYFDSEMYEVQELNGTTIESGILDAEQLFEFLEDNNLNAINLDDLLND